MLVSTKPDSKGKEAAIFRSRQLTDFKWTPVGDIPVYTRAAGKTKLPAGEEQTGMIYSSTEPTDKFITENVSFETLLTIIANPDSALYHKDLNGHSNSWPYFGVVCNGLVRYAFNIRRRYPTKLWPVVPGMRKIADEEGFTAEQVVLCDVLRSGGHVALITDILRDEDGQICQFEVSEAVRPTCIRVRYDLPAFFERYKTFALWRYDFVDTVPMPDEQQNAYLEQGVPSLPVIAVDYGNKTNYRTCEDVVISVFSEGNNEVEICCGDEVIEKIAFTGRTKISRKFDRGYYTVRHVPTGESVEFCVTEPQITHTVENGNIVVHVAACDPESKISHMEFRSRTSPAPAATSVNTDEQKMTTYYDPRAAALIKVEELTEEEKKNGVFARKIPDRAVHFKIYFENRYGVWTHTIIAI